jgi:hypothetical protein
VLKPYVNWGNLVQLKFDIFRSFPDSGPIWVGTIQGFEPAKEYVRKSQPGEYFIYDLTLGKIVFQQITAS